MTYQYIYTEQKDHIFEIVLNRPDKRNAFVVQMLQEMALAVQEAEQKTDARVIIVRGEGTCFSAGIDLMAMGGFPEALGENWRDHMYEVTRIYQAPMNRLQQSTLPTIALLHHYAIGGGFEIALGCDLRIAADDAIISLEEARLGIIPDGGGTVRLTQLVGASRAKELIFTARRIDAATAADWGLVNAVTTPDNLLEKGYELANEIAACAPLAIAAAKRTINAIESDAEGLNLEMLEQFHLFQSDDMLEGMQAGIERRQAAWKGR